MNFRHTFPKRVAKHKIVVMNSIAADLLPFPSHEIDAHGFQQRYIDESNLDEADCHEADSHSAGSDLGRDAGERETLLCVHGNPTWSFYYRRIIQQFRSTHRIVAVDHLGCGRSDKPRRDQFGYTMADHRDNLVALIDHLDLRNVTLVAHDWGGAIGLASLLQRRDRFSRIILLNTGAFPPPYVPKRIAVLRTPVLGSLAIRALNLFAKPAVTMAMSRNTMAPDVAGGLLAPYDSFANRVAVDSFVRDIPLTKKHPTYETLRQLESDLPSLADMPSLLVWGMQDWCFNASCLRHFQSVWPQSQTIQIADAGHYVIEDAPEETLHAIGNFIGAGSKAGDASRSADRPS